MFQGQRHDQWRRRWQLLRRAAATNHDINGNFIASGAVKLGAGLYTVDGYFTLGSGGGGSATCDGETISVKGVGVTLMISGKATSSSGSCNGYVFCIAAATPTSC